MKPELIFYNNSTLLEGPHWDKNNNLLYFVSIKGNTVYSLDIKSGKVKSYDTEGAVGCAVLKGENLITAEKSGIFKRNINGGEKTFICHVYDDNKFRYNDGKLDPNGRFYVGTMGDYEHLNGECGLFRIDADGSFEKVISDVTLSNGLGWLNDGSAMYYIDTPTKKIARFDYDIKTGRLGERRIVAEIETGSPDGMCVDIDDTVFVAHWGGGKVSHFNLETGEFLGEIKLPVTNVSSVCIGGEKMDTLFITTAKNPEKDEELAGGLFAVKLRG